MTWIGRLAAAYAVLIALLVALAELRAQRRDRMTPAEREAEDREDDEP